MVTVPESWNAVVVVLLIAACIFAYGVHVLVHPDAGTNPGLRVKMCVWLGVSRGLDLAFLNAD